MSLGPLMMDLEGTSITAAERESLISLAMLPLVSSSRPRCSGGASSGAPAAKNFSACGLPFSTIWKSSAVSPVSKDRAHAASRPVP